MGLLNHLDISPMKTLTGTAIFLTPTVCPCKYLSVMWPRQNID